MRQRMSVALGVLLILIVLASPASAVRPQPFFEEIEDSFTDTESCDFPIDVSFAGSIRGLEFFDRDGNLVRVQVHGSDVGTITNPANGKTATGVDHWLERFDVESGEFAILGLFFHLNFPGAGVVLIDAGHIRFDADGNVIHLAGPHQAFEGDFEEVCAALA
jgi:hypothetical protein